MIDHAYIILFLKFAMLFMMGTIGGWFLEVFWRRFLGKARRWINPGFLNGPWLPLYGFGTVILFLLCGIPMNDALRGLLFFVVLTLLEYVAGIFFTRFYNIQLWDYSNNFGNFQGIICPLYSLLWTILGYIFFFTLFPILRRDLLFLLDNLEFSLFVGFYLGIFSVDVWRSFNLAERLRKFVNETEDKWQVDFEKLKLEVRDRIHHGFINRAKFLLPFHGEVGRSLTETLRKHQSHLTQSPNNKKAEE